MQENIRKIVAAARKARCPILAVPLSVFEFARQEWETTKTSPVVVLAPSTPLRSRQNVTKSVAKARKYTQVTTSQLKPHQQHTRNFTQKHPLPPLFGKNEHRTWLSHGDFAGFRGECFSSAWRGRSC